jgi:DNA-binding NarL/FixJ family response regulator
VRTYEDSGSALSARRLRVLVKKQRRPLLDRTAMTTVRRPIDLTDATLEPTALARAVADVRLALKEAVCASEVAAARARFVADALAFLEASTAEGRAMSLVSSHSLCPDAPLSPREREVLALVVEGRSNKAIAQALYVSPNTIKTHVASLLHKLQADTRVQLAAITTKHALAQRVDFGAAIDPCGGSS